MSRIDLFFEGVRRRFLDIHKLRPSLNLGQTWIDPFSATDVDIHNTRSPCDASHGDMPRLLRPLHYPVGMGMEQPTAPSNSGATLKRLLGYQPVAPQLLLSYFGVASAAQGS